MRIIIKSIFRVIAEILYRPRVNGKENLPKQGAAIICANHIHQLDSAVLIATAKRKINILAKDDLFTGVIAKWFAKIFGIYPIKRESADIQAIKISLTLLKNNELLAVFPEGTRHGLEKGVKPKNGAIVMAIKAGVPIIPVGIQGSFKLFRKVKLNIGKPIDFNKYKNDAKNKEIIDGLTNELMNEIVKLRDEK